MTDENDFGERKKPRLSRRQVVKWSGIVAAGAAAGPFVGTSRKARAATVGNLSNAIEREAIIIGSGFGGAVTALRLSQAGVETLLLEKGRRWQREEGSDTFSPYIYPDGRSTWLSNTTVVPLSPPLPIRRYTGVLEGRDFGHIRVVTGAAYGGGSIVYGGLFVKPPKHLFERVFPAEISYDAMQRHYAQVDAAMGISSVPEDVLATEYYTHYRVMEAHCRSAGIEVDRIQTATDWDIVRAEIEGKVAPSAIRGEAIYGVESGAKRSLDMTYLADAEATGLFEARTLRQVENIGITSDGRYAIEVEAIDERGNVVAREHYVCDKLFLAAGSIGTSSLLVKARAKRTLANLNEEVGRGWANNGNVYALRTLLEESTGQWQGGPPSSAIKFYDNPIAPLYIEHPQFPLGLDLHYLLYFGIGIHDTRGEFHYDAWRDRVELRWPRFFNDQDRVNRAMLYTMNQLNRASGGVTSSLIGGPKGYKDDAVFHPLGGAVLGKACDFFGRVKGYQGLYVNDSAMIPGFTGCANPAFTTAALAERNIEEVLARDF